MPRKKIMAKPPSPGLAFWLSPQAVNYGIFSAQVLEDQMWNIWVAKIIMVWGRKKTLQETTRKRYTYIYIYIHSVYIYCKYMYVYTFGTIFGDVVFQNECLNLDPNWWEHRFCSASIEF